MKYAIVALLAIACLTPFASAQDNDEIDWANLKPETVLRAINYFEAEPLGEDSDTAMAVIMRFTDASPNVLVGINVSLMPWMKESKEVKNSEKLLAAFVAGNIRPQLQDGVNKDQPVDGVISMCRVYTAMRKAEAIEEIPALKEWSKLDRTGVELLIHDLTPPEPIPEKTAPYTDKQTGIIFPRFLDVFELEGPHEYDQKELGVSVTYWSMGATKIDVYVYDLGKTNITSGAKSEGVKQELKNAEAEVFEMGKRGYYVDVKKIANGSGGFKLKKGELDYISTTLQYAQQGRGHAEKTGAMRSYIILTSYKGCFLKVRFTQLIDDKTKGEDDVANFLEQLGKLLDPATTSEK